MGFRSTPMGRALFGKTGTIQRKATHEHLLRTAAETIDIGKKANGEKPMMHKPLSCIMGFVVMERYR